jgi:hypothetical protein
MGKRKSNPNIDADQDELDLGPSHDENGTLAAPGETLPSRAGTARIEADDTSGAGHDGEMDGGHEGIDTATIIKVPAFVADNLWHGTGMPPFGTTPVRSFRLKRLLALGLTVAFAAALGALAGSLATAGLSAPGSEQSEQVSNMKLALDRMGRELGALRASVDTSAQDVQARTARIVERLDRTERAQAEPAAKLAKVTEAIERLERRSTQPAQASNAAAADVTGSIGDARKPGIVSGWGLYQVRNGIALIEGRAGIIEVEPGDMLPGLGRVEAIRKQDGRWVVVTSRGLIVEPR